MRDANVRSLPCVFLAAESAGSPLKRRLSACGEMAALVLLYISRSLRTDSCLLASIFIHLSSQTPFLQV